jgi:ankyrin repeat protein
MINGCIIIFFFVFFLFLFFFFFPFKRPIHYATFFGHYGIVKALVDAGADVGAMTLLGKTPLIIAKEKRMKCELYEERQQKITRRDKILELLSSKPQPVSEYLYQLESFYPK